MEIQGLSPHCELLLPVLFYISYTADLTSTLNLWAVSECKLICTLISNDKEVADLIQEKTVDTVSAKVQTGDNPQVAVIKTPPVDETVKTEIFNALKDKYNLSDDDLLSVSSASASFGNEIQEKSFALHIACYNLYLDLHCNSFRVEKCYYGCYSSCNQRTYHGCDLCYNKHSA